MRRKARKGGSRLSAHQKHSWHLYLQSFVMYFVAHEHSGWPSAQTSSGTMKIKL